MRQLELPHAQPPDTFLSTTLAGIRIALRILTVIAIPFFALSTFAFVDFIYEEALQATGFACKIAIEADDDAIARSAIERFEQTMHHAQSFHRRWGKLAFWADGAYREYFFRAAPTQVAAWYAAGARRGLWKPDLRRFELVRTTDSHYFVDTWQADPIARLAIQGFDVTLLTPEERYRLAGLEALFDDAYGAPINDPSDVSVPRKER